MKKKILVAMVVAVAMLIAVSGVNAQTLDETLQKLAESAAKSYVKPIVSGFGTNFNGGLFTKAPQAKKFGLDIEIGAVVMGTFFDKEHQKFSSQGNFQFSDAQATDLAKLADVSSVPLTYQQQVRDGIRDQIKSMTFTLTISGPTVIGSKKDSLNINFEQKSFNVSVAGTNFSGVVPTTPVVLPVTGLLEEVTLIPLGAPQVKVGTILGTMATFRYLPPEVGKMLTEDKMEIKYFGWGIQHNPGAWFPNPLPIDISLGYFTQTLELGKYVSTTGTAYGINVSKQLGFAFLNITPYAGYIIEKSKMTFQYDYVVDLGGGTTSTNNIKFDLEGENTNRITLGLAIRLGLIGINADYNLGKYKSVTAGVIFVI